MTHIKALKHIKFFAFFYATVLFLFALVSALYGSANFYAYADENEDLPKNEMRVVGYIPNWSYQAYKNIDFTALTHVNVAFCNVGSNGELTSGIPDSEMAALVEKAHENDVKIMAALGGGGYGDAYRTLIAGADKINSLNQKIEAFCEKYNLDGVDLDIELNSSDAVWNYYGEWVSSLRTICDEHGWLLSTATAQWVAGSVTAETFALFDYVNVMAYDDDGSPSSHSSYQFAIDCLSYFNTQKNVPKEKLVLGVPFYGRGYSSNGALDWNSYRSFAELVEADVSNYDKDVYNGVAYNGATTMRQKCELAKEYGGVMIWEITLDAEGEFSLLSVIKEELLSEIYEEPKVPTNGLDFKKHILPIMVIVASVIVVLLVIFIVVKLLQKNNVKP